MRERLGLLWSVALTILSVLVLAGCSSFASGNGAERSVPSSPSRETLRATVAYFGWGDNMPPDSDQIMYPASSYAAAVHMQAGGTGTWQDPITFASDADEFPIGTVIWVPTLRKYFVMEHDCAACDTAWKNGRHHQIALWTGTASLSDVFSEQNCEAALTPKNGALPIVVAPPSNEPVSTTPLFDASNDRCLNGVTYVNVPSSQTAVASVTAAPAAKAKKSVVVSPTSMGILVPLYRYPSDSEVWQPLLDAKTLYPTANIVAVIKPDEGPGETSDRQFANEVAQLKAAGIGVLGYVHTNYGAESISSLKLQMKRYRQWYGTDGMFFDEMANSAGLESYYSALTAYAKTLGMNATVGNPGADTVASYVGTVTTLIVYENVGFPEKSSLCGGWHAKYSPSNFAFIAYDVPSLEVVPELNDAACVRYEYVTDGGEPNPYAKLPAYFITEVENI